MVWGVLLMPTAAQEERFQAPEDFALMGDWQGQWIDPKSGHERRHPHMAAQLLYVDQGKCRVRFLPALNLRAAPYLVIDADIRPDGIVIDQEGWNVTFRDDEHVHNIIDRIITPLGRHIDETSPRVDARLPDGSRLNAIIPPLALDGPLVSIRRFGASPLTVDDLLANREKINAELQKIIDDLEDPLAAG